MKINLFLLKILSIKLKYSCIWILQFQNEILLQSSSIIKIKEYKKLIIIIPVGIISLTLTDRLFTKK